MPQKMPPKRVVVAFHPLRLTGFTSIIKRLSPHHNQIKTDFRRLIALVVAAFNCRRQMIGRPKNTFAT